jgi:hypothetical protein
MNDGHSNLESSKQHKKKKVDGWSFLNLSCHPSAFFSAAAACLCTSLAMINIVPFTFLSASITYIGAQIAKLLCKLAIHRHQCGLCPAYFRFSIERNLPSS